MVVSLLQPEFAGLELILAARGIVVSYETIREWGLRFGRTYAKTLNGAVHGQETNGFWTRCSSASGANCTTSGGPLTSTGTCSTSWSTAAEPEGRQALLRKLLKRQGIAPSVLITDKLASYAAAEEDRDAQCGASTA